MNRWENGEIFLGQDTNRHRSENVGRHHTSKPHPIGENAKSGSFRMRPFIGTGRKRTGLAPFLLTKVDGTVHVYCWFSLCSVPEIDCRMVTYFWDGTLEGPEDG